MTSPSPAPKSPQRPWLPIAVAAAVFVAAGAAIVLLGERRPAEPSKQSAQTLSEAPLIPSEVLAKLARGVDDVTLIDSDGKSVRWADLNGAPRVVFFGFTHCPEICPTTMATLASAMEQAGPAAKGLQIDFVTVDPERDTPAVLKTYLSSFGPQVRGLGGDPAAVKSVASSFRASYKRSDIGNGDYTMDHTTLVYLLDASGQVVDVVAYGAAPDRVAAQLARLAKATPAETRS